MEQRSRRQRAWEKACEELVSDPRIVEALHLAGIIIPAEPDAETAGRVCDEILGDLLIRHGLTAAGEPNRDGLKAEDLMDKVNRFRLDEN